MAIQNEQLKNLVGRVTSFTREFPVVDPETKEETPITFHRLLLPDMSKLDEELGTNLFAAMTEAASKGEGGGGGIPKEWDYKVQLEVFFRSLKKVEPNLNKSEAAEIVALLPAAEYWKAFAWIVFGTMGDAEKELDKFQS